MATITQVALCIESALNDAPATADTVPSGQRKMKKRSHDDALSSYTNPLIT